MTNKEKDQKDSKPDLKHDTMEYAASTSGDDSIKLDNPPFEEDEITAEELEALEDTPENEAAALNAEQTDVKADPDNLPDENWTDELPDTSNNKVNTSDPNL